MTGDTSGQLKVAAVERAIKILLSFRAGESRTSLAQLAERTGMHKSTILRLLQTLEGDKLVLRLADGGYRLGPTVLHLGMNYRKSFRLEDIVVPELQSLTNALGESSSFFVAEGDVRYCLYRSEAKRRVRHTVEIGEPLPLGRGATGTVFTAFAKGSHGTPIEAFRQLPIVFTGNGPLDISVVCGPVFGIAGELKGAVSLSGPTSRFDAKAIRKASPLLMDSLLRLTARLGGDPAVFSPRQRKKVSEATIAMTRRLD